MSAPRARLLCKASLLALGCCIFAQPAVAQSTAAARDAAQIPAANAALLPPAAGPAKPPADNEEIRITGSRIITTNLKSPTPVTAVSAAELAKTTPSDIPDALNKLPTIIGGSTPRTQGNGSTNNGANTLSLRNFGPMRTLILLDGHRVAPSNQNGTVNIDILPQMMVSRVEIVTGGASAIYGSDAVAGVVNFILDKKFTGLPLKADVGESKYGDGKEYQLGAAWGTDLFGGRGHFETSARYRRQARIPISARPYGRMARRGCWPATVSPTNPYVNVPYSRVFNSGQYSANVQGGSASAPSTTTPSTSPASEPNGPWHPHRHGQPGIRGRRRLREVRHLPFRNRR